MDGRLRIVVTGLIAQHPALGGVAWDYVQYLLGFARMGHDVYYVEDSGQWPYRRAGSGDDPNGWIAEDSSENTRHLETVLSQFGLGDRWAYRFPIDGEWFGLPDRARREVLATADLVVDVSGCLERPDEYRGGGPLVYIDSDPVFTQVRLAAGADDLGLPPEEAVEEEKFAGRVAAHDVHFSFGEARSSLVPETPYRWRPTRQPIALDEWEPADAHRGVFTTVMNWTSYRPLRFGGRVYGQKDVELRRFLALPGRVRPGALEVALNDVHHAAWEHDPGGAEAASPAEVLTGAGWRVADATAVAPDLNRYRDYIRASAGEWGIAKNGYVVGQPGWFSCRSACYLAAGRPVVVQDTGFGSVLPTGEGIVSFRTLDEAADGIGEVEGRYEVHAKAAREIATEHFDARRVLGRLVEEAMS